jgi:hypothetical protein
MQANPPKTFKDFDEDFTSVFGTADQVKDATKKMVELRQNSKPVSDLVTEFMYLKPYTKWNDESVSWTFLHALDIELYNAL